MPPPVSRRSLWSPKPTAINGGCPRSTEWSRLVRLGRVTRISMQTHSSRSRSRSGAPRFIRAGVSCRRTPSSRLGAASGVTFVGPPVRHLVLMGDKAKARDTMKALGMPVIPGSDGPLSTVDEARELAEVIGYPVLLKAVAGGGGRGMRGVDSPGRSRRHGTRRRTRRSPRSVTTACIWRSGLSVVATSRFR